MRGSPSGLVTVVIQQLPSSVLVILPSVSIDAVCMSESSIERDDKIFAYRLSSASFTIRDVPDGTPIDEVLLRFCRDKIAHRVR